MGEGRLEVRVVDQVPVLLAGFAAEMAGRAVADRTRTGYLDRVTQYLRWLAASDHTDALDTEAARDAAVAAWLAEAALAPRSVQTSLAALATFYDWHGLGAPNTARVSADLHIPRTLSPPEHRALLTAAAARGPREFALIVLTLDTGVRVHEVPALDVDDLDLTGWPGQITLTSASGRVRTVAITAATRAAITAWLAQRRQQLRHRAHPTRALFIARTGARIAHRSVDRVIRTVGHDAGLVLAPGTLRATGAAQLLAAGVDPSAVAARLGVRALPATRIAALLGHHQPRVRTALTDSEQLTLFGDIT